MHNLKSVLENESYKLLLDFEVQTDLLISAQRQDLVIVNKKKRRLCRLGRLKWKKKKTKDKYNQTL